MKDVKKHLIGMFKDLGFLISPYDFDHIIPNVSFKQEVMEFNTDAAKILRFSPDFFIMPAHIKGNEERQIEIVKNQIFFIKLLNLRISKEELEIYNKYYKDTKIMVLYINKENQLILLDKFLNIKEKTPTQPLTTFLLNIKLDKPENEIKDIMSKWEKIIFG